MITSVDTPAPRHIWEEIIQADPHALVFQTPEWLAAMCEAGPFVDASRLYTMSSGKKLLLPMVRRKGLPASLTTQASQPHAWGMGGLLSSEPLEVEDIAAVFADLAVLPALQTSIRPNPLHGDLWAAAAPSTVLKVPRVAHVLELDSDFDVVWKDHFKSTTRTAVRKAEKSGLVVECDTTGKLLPAFYSLLEQSFDRWAEQQHEPLLLSRFRAKQRDPLSKFEVISRVVGQAAQTWIAWLDGEPAAALLVLQGKNANYTRGAMNKDLAGPSQANVLLQKMAIEDACRAGCRYYHMGETGQSSSLSQFKERFGAVAYQYAEYRLERVPITSIDRNLRTFVKKLTGFKDA